MRQLKPKSYDREIKEEIKGEIEQENQNFKEEYNEDVEEMKMEHVFAKNLSHLLNEYVAERNDKESTTQFELCELPQMISGQVTKILTEIEDSKSREYGWHFICSCPFQAGTEIFHINSSVEHYYNQSIADQNSGIFDVIYREYLIDFLLPPKMSKQQIHLVAFRVKRGHESVIGNAIGSLKSVKLLDLLSVASIHKVFFLLLLVTYFGNRFLCGKFDKIDYSSQEEDYEVGYIEGI